MVFSWRDLVEEINEEVDEWVDNKRLDADLHLSRIHTLLRNYEVSNK